MSETKADISQGVSAEFMEELYAKFLAGANDLDASWQCFFQGLEFAQKAQGSSLNDSAAKENACVEAFINAFRRLGHLSAHLNPLVEKPALLDNVRAETHDLGHVAADKLFHPANLPDDQARTFGDIVEMMTNTYCRSVGADFREIDDIERVTWLQEKMESCQNLPTFSLELKKRILLKLSEAEGFEKFLHARYLGQKRFSLEGTDAMVPLLDVLCSDAAEAGVEEIGIGMAHRGRLNVLANIMGKDHALILKEFQGSEFNPFDIDGDVKYHKGFFNEVETFGGKKLHLYLSPNPSHLEAVNPVLTGFVRGRQKDVYKGEESKVLPVLLHGDAAFISQGVVAETLNFERLRHYQTGGTIHVIINNQIGFTTDPSDARSSTYSSGIAKMIRAPVLHVNADDVEAVVWTAQLAVAYRQTFGRDIVIDLIGYRRHGHNEGDEPAFTQPQMYKKIKAHPTAWELYMKKLVAEGSMSEADVKQLAAEIRQGLQKDYEKLKADPNSVSNNVEIPDTFAKVAEHASPEYEEILTQVETGVDQKRLAHIGRTITQPPENFALNSKLKRLLKNRAEMVGQDGRVDWPMAELLAFGSLALEGRPVRLSGQDCMRGTFSSRQAVLFDGETGESLSLLNRLEDGLEEGLENEGKQGPVDIINSPLSEMGVMGFEFGYTVAQPHALVCWEAQFGDFCNGAQVIIDQFMAASEKKWRQTSGLVLLLPHGYEGQGPEHSSGRPERFLQLCGNLNMQVVIPTTGAQYFHVLRRQLHRPFRKPLIVMTPKSLLRDARVASPIKELSTGGFQEVLDDPNWSSEAKVKKGSVERVLLCAGKVYYDLLACREAHAELAQTPIIRLEQPYPFPKQALKATLERYQAKHVVWVQEEPQNMGCWTFVEPRLRKILSAGVDLEYVGRKSSGTTAEGSQKAHQVEQERIVQNALGMACAWDPKERKHTPNGRSTASRASL